MLLATDCETKGVIQWGGGVYSSRLHRTETCEDQINTYSFVLNRKGGGISSEVDIFLDFHKVEEW